MTRRNPCRLPAVAWLFLLPGLVAFAVLAGEPPPEGPFSDGECIRCHTGRDPDLITQWREGPHAPASGVLCSSCHGDRHETTGTGASVDQSCSDCHAGPASHSYKTSKHGVINRLEKNRQDRRLPLRRGNYRAPGCSYCHLHDGDHGDRMAPARGPESRQWICSGCHSPRFVREQIANAGRQLEIADLKRSEGEALLGPADPSQPDRFAELRRSLNRHRQNVLLGVGHQSPDYQWWHGQPALDGDLIRIRDAVAESRRHAAPVEKMPQHRRDGEKP